MFQKLDDVVLKHEELTKLLMDPEVISDPKKIMEYNKLKWSVKDTIYVGVVIFFVIFYIFLFYF